MEASIKNKKPAIAFAKAGFSNLLLSDDAKAS